MKKFLLCITVLYQAALFCQTVNYTATSDIIANPGRGLQKYSITSSDYATVAGANNLSVATLESWKNSTDKVTVVFRYFLLDAFINKDIDPIYLDNMQGDFDNIRTAGCKVIVRFSYSDAQGSGAQQPTKAQILDHIDQLAPYLAVNQDVILTHQAGFIGTWGEWYYTNSTEFGTDGSISPTQWANRKEIVDAMLSATPASIPLQVRYAEVKQIMYGSTLLTAQSAYQNTPSARIGFYNDAFLNRWGDQGTYSASSVCEDPVGNFFYNYLANETQYLPMTGETNALDSCTNGFRTSGANAITEMELTHWTTINRDYYLPFWDGVISSGHYDEILQQLGYRFSMISSTITTDGTDFDFTLSLANQGFARVFTPKDVYLVLEDTTTGDTTSFLINTDIRTWEDTVTLSQNFTPGVFGTFNVYLWMPDHSPSLRANPDYSIRMANSNTWQASTGFNSLSQTVTIDAGLPVELLSFEATQHREKGVSLHWTTATEHDSDYFSVERTTDGRDWATMATLNAAGNTTRRKQYYFHDQEATGGTYLYRLKLVDLDNSLTYSEVKTVEIGPVNKLTVYPNPSNRILDIKGFFAGEVVMQIFNIQGQDVTAFTTIISQNDEHLRLNVAALRNGTYLIRLGDRSVSFIKR